MSDVRKNVRCPQELSAKICLFSDANFWLVSVWLCDTFIVICRFILIKANMDVFIPKFKLESTHNLKNVLIKLGLTSAFGNANFSKITTDVPLKIDNVVQKAFIEVNEEGTEAAAATRYPYTPTSPSVEEETFLADHPFTFMLMKKNEILFCGIFQG
uniref:Serpin domain-containing protein n=2 Tax=Meloidogyne TaxID=189290 RepID=A0A6V7W1T9_MELEN|nr:unnamed protein product [Meloidogyne enterolobii]